MAINLHYNELIHVLHNMFVTILVGTTFIRHYVQRCVQKFAPSLLSEGPTFR